jgi:Cu/Ag efflux protein CusF
MSIGIRRIAMQKLAVIAALAVGATFAMSAAAQTGAVAAGTAPGMAGVAQTVKITATITAIDKASRDVTLKGPQGNEVTVTAGPEVKKFDSLKVGDQVDVQYVEALTLELKKGGGMVVARTEQKGAVGTKPGATPGGAMGRKVTIVADVVGLDPAKQVVTLKGPQRTVELKVPDPEQFKRIAKGDQVEATYTQALALVVEPTAKK